MDVVNLDVTSRQRSPPAADSVRCEAGRRTCSERETGTEELFEIKSAYTLSARSLVKHPLKCGRRSCNDNQAKTAGEGQLGQDSHGRTAGAGQPKQVSWGRTADAGQLGQDSRGRTAGI